MRTYRAADVEHPDDRPEHLSIVLEEHRAIADAIVGGDPKKAEAAARLSVRQATEEVYTRRVRRPRRGVTGVANGPLITCAAIRERTVLEVRLHFQLHPHLWRNLIAFKDFSVVKGIVDSPWAGLRHFRDLF